MEPNGKRLTTHSQGGMRAAHRARAKNALGQDYLGTSYYARNNKKESKNERTKERKEKRNKTNTLGCNA